MAVFADLRRSYVSRTFAGCVRAVMAGATGSHNLCVVDDRHGHKHSCVVAVFTDICRLNVCRVLAGRLRAIVTADAVTNYVHVIE